MLLSCLCVNLRAGARGEHLFDILLARSSPLLEDELVWVYGFTGRICLFLAFIFVYFGENLFLGQNSCVLSFLRWVGSLFLSPFGNLSLPPFTSFFLFAMRGSSSSVASVPICFCFIFLVAGWAG